MAEWLCCLLAGIAGLSTGAASVALFAWQQQRQEQRQQQTQQQHQVQRQSQTQAQQQTQRQEQSATSVFRVEVQEGGNVNIAPLSGETDSRDE